MARGRDRWVGDGPRRAIGPMAGAVQAVLWPSRAVAGLADVRPRSLQRQRPQVDAGYAGAGHRACLVSGLSTLRDAAPWDATQVWRRLRAVIPERRGRADSGRDELPQAGAALGGRGASVCGALGKIANCQVATTVALWTGRRAWFLGTALYLSEAWLTAGATTGGPHSRGRAVSRKVASRLDAASAGPGRGIHAHGRDRRCGIWRCPRLRTALHRLGLPYALGISSNLMVFVRRPRVTRRRGSRTGTATHARRLVGGSRPQSVREMAQGLPASRLAACTWRNGAQPSRHARFAALRVTPPRLARGTARADVWLLCEQEEGSSRADQVLLHICRARYRCAGWSLWRINAGRSSSSIKN